MTDKKLIAFDLDGTLTRSRQALEPHIASLLCELLKEKKVVIISGGAYSQYQNQFLSGLNCENTPYDNLFLMPASGSQLYIYKNGVWERQIDSDLSEEMKDKIRGAFVMALSQVGFDMTAPSYGERFQDRGTQFSFSALGQDAPLEEKSAWDPDQTKRKEVVSIMETMLPEFSIKIGGTTTIDVNMGGTDKASAMKQITNLLNIDLKDCLFIGDALYEGGNDYVVKGLGIDTIQVDNDNGRNTEDIEKVLKKLIS